MCLNVEIDGISFCVNYGQIPACLTTIANRRFSDESNIVYYFETRAANINEHQAVVDKVVGLLKSESCGEEWKTVNREVVKNEDGECYQLTLISFRKNNIDLQVLK